MWKGGDEGYLILQPWWGTLPRRARLQGCHERPDAAPGEDVLLAQKLLPELSLPSGRVDTQ